MNIYDVARKAGVSTTTVSRVINGSDKVSDKTLEKVQKVMEEMNYTPSQLAVGLATNVTRTIGIMLPDVRDSFHAAVAYLIESKMTAQGYTCILCNTSVENSKETDYLNALYNKKVDGIILVGSSYHSKKIDEAYSNWRRKIPIVMINAISGEGTASVVCDERQGLTDALMHLKKRGRQYPIFIKDGLDYQKRASVTKAEAFIKGYQDVYQTEEIPMMFTCEPEIVDYDKVIKEIQNKKVDSVLFTSDLCCAVFLKAMQNLGLEAPKDYALVGFNNARITDLTSPTITTLDHLVADHCEVVIDKLFKMMEGKEVEKVTYIKPRLVIKETT